MKNYLLKFFILIFGVGFFLQITAQTQGTLAFSYTPTSHGTGNHALAIWINGGDRTLYKYCDAATYNYLPNWASFANCGFQGTTIDATSTLCRLGGTTTGAPLTSYAPMNVVWDGLTYNGNLACDCTDLVYIEETWGTGSTHTAVRYFPFVKGPAIDDQTTGITNDANFTGVSLIWQPYLATATFETAKATIYPNPSKNGVFDIDFKDTVNSIKVYNTLGAVIYHENVSFESNATKKLDLSNFSNGIYTIILNNDNGSSNYKVVVDK